MTRRTIGVREAKAQLSKVLGDIKQGAEWVITDRGKPVAKIVPIPREALSVEERIRGLEERGWIEPVREPTTNLPPPIPIENDLAQRWLREDRSQ